ncbi:hypothetical protein ALC57_03321 [Trachymyrmex cornetzi]|uniref:Uncharacterized protein n=1 Tax=Trachymyrmex cornetzi TaxID=471704 RepID=A0A195EFC6_9HYME|nr:hypothetical protein ALC57_03321 [Trachymyrmex cornetzi]
MKRDTQKVNPNPTKSNNQEIISITTGLPRPRNPRGRIGTAYKFELSIPSSAPPLVYMCVERMGPPVPLTLYPFCPPVGFVSGTLVKGVRHTHPKKEEESVELRIGARRGDRQRNGTWWGGLL